MIITIASHPINRLLGLSHTTEFNLKTEEAFKLIKVARQPYSEHPLAFAVMRSKLKKDLEVTVLRGEDATLVFLAPHITILQTTCRRDSEGNIQLGLIANKKFFSVHAWTLDGELLS